LVDKEKKKGDKAATRRVVIRRKKIKLAENLVTGIK